MSLGHLTRLMPDPYVDPDRALGARLHDAAWLLARQWQLGELAAMDAGSPVGVRHQSTIGRIEAVTLDEGSSWQPYQPSARPLGAVVEAVPAPDSRELRLRTGQQLVRALRRAGIGAMTIRRLANQHPLAADSTSSPEVALAEGLIPDGRASWDALVDNSVSPPTPAAGVTDPAMLAGVSEWIDTCGSLLAQPARTGWDPHDLTHRFAGLAGTASGGIELVAADHPGGPVAWWSVDGTAATTNGTVVGVTNESIATRAAFPGMPVPRWWELEEHRIDLAAVTPTNADLAKTAMLQFGLLYGNDHFLLPVRLPLGSVCETTALSVTDSFGRTTEIPASSGPGWTLFTLTGAPGAPFAVMPGDQPDSARTLATLHLLRDEMANLVWAMDGTTPAAPAGQFTPPTVGNDTYRLRRNVPPGWHAMVQDPANPSTLVPSPATTELPGLVGELSGGVKRNAVPAAGLRIVLEVVVSRWSDGSTHLRCRHRTSVDHLMSTPGLAFDEIEYFDTSGP
jgi:hypothetical protein